MAKRLTELPTFYAMTDKEKAEIFTETELTVQRLERIIRGLLIWKEDTIYYNEFVDEFNQYLNGE